MRIVYFYISYIVTIIQLCIGYMHICFLSDNDLQNTTLFLPTQVTENCSYM